jgi:hypothetical protein
MFAKVKSLLLIPDLKTAWQIKKNKMLADKIDVTSFWCWLVQNYPESEMILKQNPDYQNRFK